MIPESRLVGMTLRKTRLILKYQSRKPMLSYSKLRFILFAFLIVAFVPTFFPPYRPGPSLLLQGMAQTRLTTQRSCDTYKEAGGLVVMKTESANLAGKLEPSEWRSLVPQERGITSGNQVILPGALMDLARAY